MTAGVMMVEWFLVDGKGHALTSGVATFRAPADRSGAYDSALIVGDQVERALLASIPLPIAADAPAHEPPAREPHTPARKASSAARMEPDADFWRNAE